ncbi:hypothetical protein [Pseudomonas typographi]|uniref:hypothetical protein n=1 Tax=Pseudomonas typographi TaxID=2715964 RepID=UPI0016828678|nr:hypothetical protein [Pseudomonas typographi]MBD1552331.1 hypothetical protein [Pseudomonas typographi]
MSKPLEYHFELYENSFTNDPIWSVKSSSPFPAAFIGDRFEHRTLADLSWNKLPTADQEFRVKDIEHLYWELNENIGHKLIVKLEIVEQTQDF